MTAVQNRYLVVVKRSAGKIRQWVQLQQRLCLRADRHGIAWKGLPSCRIVDHHRLAERVDQIGKITRSLRIGRYKAGLCRGSAVARPRIGCEESRTTRHEMRDLQGATEGEDAGDAIVSSLRRVEPAER